MYESALHCFGRSFVVMLKHLVSIDHEAYEAALERMGDRTTHATFSYVAFDRYVMELFGKEGNRVMDKNTLTYSRLPSFLCGLMELITNMPHDYRMIQGEYTFLRFDAKEGRWTGCYSH